MSRFETAEVKRTGRALKEALEGAGDAPDEELVNWEVVGNAGRVVVVMEIAEVADDD